MRATGPFTVTSFVPTDLTPEPAIVTALPVVVSRMEKRFEGQVSGRAATLFTAAFDDKTQLGTYVAMESFEGSLNAAAWSFCFVHSTGASGTDRVNEFFAIVPNSGTVELAGITGSGGVSVDPDGTHRIWFDYSLG